MKYLIIFLVLIVTACSAKVIKSNSANSILAKLKNGQDIILKDQTITEELDLTSIVSMQPIDANSSRGQIRGNLYFNNCIFTKPVKGYKRVENDGIQSVEFLGNVSFVNCTFEEEFSIKNAAVRGVATFSDSTFKKHSNFQDVTWLQPVFFSGAFWQDEVQFQNSRFYHKSNFMHAKANGHLMFQSAVFHDETNFSMTECAKYVDFSLVKFSGNATFNYIKWKDRAVFNNAITLMDLVLVQPEFGDVSFKGCDVRGQFKLSGETISGTLIEL